MMCDVHVVWNSH